MRLVQGHIISVATGQADWPLPALGGRGVRDFLRPARQVRPRRRGPDADFPQSERGAFLRRHSGAALAVCAAVTAMVAVCAAALVWSELRPDSAPAPTSAAEAMPPTPGPPVVPATAPAPAPAQGPARTPGAAGSVRSAPPPAPRPQPKTRSLGTFLVTAYCPCAECCGKWAKLPESERPPLRGPYCAADLSVLPRGSRVLVEGVGWLQVSDTGSDVVGRQIDLLMKSHWRALRFGRQWRKVHVRVQ